MAQKRKSEPSEVLIVNDVPGEECRVAILQDGHLEELYSEKTATATNVGNIYLGRVTNVESAIQAAFVDFGEGQNGFLHVSDLHPRHFPGDEQTERVGRKIPRRERPAIQECLKRGQQILVQVLKEGIGTKGPTLTSYLSIPGRLLVAMPFMDKVGVSRRVEDDDQRREMRKVLDQLDLPEGFGFILRTAGFGRTKTDLKRDVAYLMRLWKTMEKRQQGERAPCELYRESDLLIRTIRDVLRPSISAVIIDSEDGYNRARNFVRVIAPRSAPRVIHYKRPAPIFHAFDIERQIDLIHSREVPLPSGGSIVIEQTEALVAIDVNSGRSLKARDSETNAFETNREAVDEICRQLRLRDLGGLIINDLIDMRPTRNRRKIEERVRENLKRDRAKSTALRISDFGILEMTRQRMRPSMRKAHFVTCPNCNGHGEIMSAESVASNAVRHARYLLQYERIDKVEIVCSPRVASVMLSAKRRQLVQVEDETGSVIEVRVSDAIATDRVDFYAYDARGTDVDITRLKPLAVPKVDDLERESPASDAAEDDVAIDELDSETEEDQPVKKKRRRRSRSRKKTSETASADVSDVDADVPAEPEAEQKEAAEDGEASTEPATRKKRRRRGRRGGRRRSKNRDAAAATESSEQQPEVEDVSPDAPSVRVHALAKELGVASREVVQRADDDDSITIKNHMSSVSAAEAQTIRTWFNDSVTAAASTNEEVVDDAPVTSATDDEQPTSKRRRRSRRRSKKKTAATTAASTDDVAASTDEAGVMSEESDAAEDQPATKKKRRRRSRKSGTKVTTEPMDEAPSQQEGDDGVAPKKKTRRRRRSKAGTASDNGAADSTSQADSSTSDDAPATVTVKKTRRRCTHRVAACRPALGPLRSSRTNDAYGSQHIC